MENLVKSYTFYNENGKITSNLTASDEVLQLVLENTTENYIEGEYSPENYYIEAEVAVEKAIKPAIYYDFNYITKTWELNSAVASQIVINTRNQLLLNSDWTDTVSAVERLGQAKYEEWQTYRQNLRDIPQQEGFPLNVTFPTVPE